jgi:hypothetical protein
MLILNKLYLSLAVVSRTTLLDQPIKTQQSPLTSVNMLVQTIPNISTFLVVLILIFQHRVSISMLLTRALINLNLGLQLQHQLMQP